MFMDKFAWLDDNTGGYAPPSLWISVGLGSAGLNSVGLFVFWRSSASNIRKRRIIKSLLVLLCLWVTVSDFVYNIPDAANLADSFKAALRKAMQKYKDGAEVKLMLDKLQWEYSCCGNDNFRDWFLTPWTPDNYRTLHFDDVARWVCTLYNYT